MSPRNGRTYYLGPMNGHAAGRIIKETVRRATVLVRNKQTSFEASKKKGYSGRMDDVFTDADHEAQEIYVRMVRECFPDFGIIAEEQGLRREPRRGCRVYAFIDPLDGTKAFIRKQSHGVGTMIALVEDGQVISAYIGDINTNECFGYRPGSMRVHRIRDLDRAERLRYRPPEGKRRYILLRDPPASYSKTSQTLIKSFDNFQVDGGSIGTWMARLWKGEVSAVLLPKGNDTPWDTAPIYGISKKLGFGFYWPNDIGRTAGPRSWVRFDPDIPYKVKYREHDVLITHPKNIRRILGA